MADNVGQLLSSHGSALSSAIASMARSAIEADAYAKDLCIERTRKIMKFPPTEMDQYIMYTVPTGGEGGGPQTQIVRFTITVPTFIFIQNEPFVFTKYVIKSAFEASIHKKTGLQSETNIGVSGKAGFMGIPSIGFDISEKLTVNHDSEEKQSNSMEVEVEMGQGQPSFGYIEVVKAFVRCVNKIIDEVLARGFENPAALTDEEAKKLSEEANIPIVDAAGPADGKSSDADEPDTPRAQAA